jgi:hypothetical protein
LVAGYDRLFVTTFVHWNSRVALLRLGMPDEIRVPIGQAIPAGSALALNKAHDASLRRYTEGRIMSKLLDEALTANEWYAGDFDKGDLAMPPARRFAILG